MKTYLPKLLKILVLVCGYILRWQKQLKENIPEEHWPKLDAVVTACEALEAVVEPLVPGQT